MDALVTGLLLWWVVASIYGIKKATEHKTEEAGNVVPDPKREASKQHAKKILKMLIFGCEEEVQDKKKGFFQKLFKK